jgi:hypothetical protein
MFSEIAISLSRVGWHVGTALDPYARGAVFESRPGHCPAELTGFVWTDGNKRRKLQFGKDLTGAEAARCLFVSLKTNPGLVARLGNYSFLPNPFQFISHPTILCNNYDTDSVVK